MLSIFASFQRLSPFALARFTLMRSCAPFSLVAEPFMQFTVVLDGDAVEEAGVDELLQIHTVEAVLTKGVVAGLSSGPFPRETDLLRRPKILDPGHQQSMQRARRVDADKVGIPLNHGVDPSVRLSAGFGGLACRSRGQVFLSVPLASNRAGEVGQHGDDERTNHISLLCDLFDDDPDHWSASHAARWVACHGVGSHPVPVALVGECSIPVV
jgi:hypothetical protein